MPKNRTDLIMHPIRFRLLQTLLGKRLTTQQISQDMRGVPTSSIYRHLKTLLDAGLVQVVETNRVKGIEEKVYTTSELLVLTEKELRGTNPPDWQHYFGVYLSYLYQRYSEFVTDERIEKIEDEQAGFTEAIFYATRDELNELAAKVNEALEPLRNQEKDPQRQRQLFSVITFPVERKEE